MWSITLATFGGAVYVFNIWERIGEEMLSTFLYSSWDIGRGNLKFLPDLAEDMN